MAKGFIRKLLLPKEEKFFPMFEDMAEMISKAAHLLARIIDHNEPSAQEETFREIKLLETKADDIVHQVFDTLDSTFITPFDREDIQRLTSKMDDVLDFINSTSQQIRLYKPKKLLPQFRELCLVVVRGCEQIRIAVLQLHNLKDPGKINNACVKINELENIADDIYHQLISEYSTPKLIRSNSSRTKKFLNRLNPLPTGSRMSRIS
jgi:uncharacterized protein